MMSSRAVNLLLWIAHLGLAFANTHLDWTQYFNMNVLYGGAAVFECDFLQTRAGSPESRLSPHDTRDTFDAKQWKDASGQEFAIEDAATQVRITRIFFYTKMDQLQKIVRVLYDSQTGAYKEHEIEFEKTEPLTEEDGDVDGNGDDDSMCLW